VISLQEREVDLVCIFCRHVFGRVMSTYPGTSHGICRSQSCQHRHAEAMKAARRGK
jgi:hypothetical protein